MPTISGTYIASKANWFTTVELGQIVDNRQRWENAHIAYGDLPNAHMYQHISFNFSLMGVIAPPNDDTHRTNAHNFANRSDITNGGDFLWRGNYVHPTMTVVSINGSLPPGTYNFYFAGNPTSFDGGPPGTIVRNWIELVTTAKLGAFLIDGNVYTIVYNN